jgi:polyisoprenoid-binding protein YceI
MQRTRTLYLVALLGALALRPARAQEPTFGTAPPDTTKSDTATPESRGATPGNDSGAAATAAGPRVPPEIAAMDSVTYQLAPTSRLEVKTGKAGLIGFAGHSHLIHARAFSGRVVYYPKAVPSSHLEITIMTDSLAVLTPPDTAEIRQVTEAMRGPTLHVDQYPDIKFVSKAVKPTSNGFHITGALTIVGQTREVPIDVAVQLAPDSLRAQSTFSVKQTDFGIKPYSGGPGGTVKVADKVTFTIDAVAVRSGGRPAVTGRT